MENEGFFRQIRNDFIAKELQLQEESKRKFGVATDEIVSFLQDSSTGQFRHFPWRFKRILKSGSLAKGTAVKGYADLDLVCFVEKSRRVPDPDELLRKRETIIADIADKFGVHFRWVKEGSRWTRRVEDASLNRHQKKFIPLYHHHNEYMLNIKLVEACEIETYVDTLSEELESDQRVIDVDIVLGFDLGDHVGQKPGDRARGSQVFSFIAQQDHPVKFADQFSASLAEMQ